MTGPFAENRGDMAEVFPKSTASTGIGHSPSEHRYSPPMGQHEERAVTALAVASTIHCVECLRPWAVPSERWRLKVLGEEDGFETVPYCPSCASREFGPLR
jgi:hypothetical protein